MLQKISFLLSFLLMFVIVNLTCCTLVKSTSFPNDSKQLSKQHKNINSKINNMYFLGDSLLDTGGFIKVIHCASQELKNNFVVNTFFNDKLEQLNTLKLPNFYYGNSFSNGPVISENLTDKCNKTIKSGWDLNLNILDLINIKTTSIGNNYAFSGSQAYYNEQTDQILRKQLADLIANDCDNVDEVIKVLFKQMLNQFALVKQADALIKHHANNIKTNDLFLIQIGGNDIGRLIEEITILKKLITMKKQLIYI